jgi:hypothetical protein
MAEVVCIGYVVVMVVADGGCCSLAGVVGECGSLAEVGVNWRRGATVSNLVQVLSLLLMEDVHNIQQFCQPRELPIDVLSLSLDL